MKIKLLIEKLEQLTGKKVSLVEADKFVANISLKAGDVVVVQDAQYIIAGREQTGRSIIQFNVAPVRSLKNVLATGEGMMRLKTRPGSDFRVVGTCPPKDLKKLQDIVAGRWEKETEYKNKNHEQKNWDRDRNEYYVTLANGKKAYKGDTVKVRFSNAISTGVIKQVAGGSKSGDILVSFPRREKARGVSAGMIIDVI